MKPTIHAHVVGAALLAALATFSGPAAALTVWTDWTRFSAGEPGSATGTLDGIGVSYSGEVLSNSVVNGGFAASWAPATTFVGGTVSASPAGVGDIVMLDGSALTNTLLFSSPITDPVIAIWSLGSPRAAASFTFSATPTLDVGGPNASFGGSSIVVSGNTISGSEGNGVVHFSGIFSSLSFTSTAEFFYGFTVGQNGVTTPPPPAMPEPGTWALMLAGLTVIGGAARRRPAVRR